MEDNGKPQPEHLCNDITFTLVPLGCYRVPSHFMFFLITRIDSVCRCYFTQNGSVFLSHIWVHRGVHFLTSSRGEIPVSCHVCNVPHKNRKTGEKSTHCEPVGVSLSPVQFNT